MKICKYTTVNACNRNIGIIGSFCVNYINLKKMDVLFMDTLNSYYYTTDPDECIEKQKILNTYTRILKQAYTCSKEEPEYCSGLYKFSPFGECYMEPNKTETEKELNEDITKYLQAIKMIEVKIKETYSKLNEITK